MSFGATCCFSSWERLLALAKTRMTSNEVSARSNNRIIDYEKLVRTIVIYCWGKQRGRSIGGHIVIVKRRSSPNRTSLLPCHLVPINYHDRRDTYVICAYILNGQLLVSRIRL